VSYHPHARCLLCGELSPYEEIKDIEARRLGIPVLDEDEVVLTRSGIRAWVESLPRRSIGGG